MLLNAVAARHTMLGQRLATRCWGSHTERLVTRCWGSHVERLVTQSRLASASLGRVAWSVSSRRMSPVYTKDDSLQVTFRQMMRGYTVSI